MAVLITLGSLGALSLLQAFFMRGKGKKEKG